MIDIKTLERPTEVYIFTMWWDFCCFYDKFALVLLIIINALGNMNNLGTQIKERRKALKITQQELADLAGISINTVVAVERGQGDPKISTYLAICNVLGLKLNTTL